MTERLDKVLAHHGLGTRNDVKKLLRRATVTVNGARVTDPGARIDLLHDALMVDGAPLHLQRDQYLMMNKCAGVVCSARGGVHRTVFDLLHETSGSREPIAALHTIGRLDCDTEGLLLLTTDGALTHRLISPRTHVPKTYAVRLRDHVDARVKADYVRRFALGLHVPREGNACAFDAQSAVLSWLDGSAAVDDVTLRNAAGCDCLLTIYEGKFHQVRRMFTAVGNEVAYLKRVAVGALLLDPALAVGGWRALTSAELGLLP